MIILGNGSAHNGRRQHQPAWPPASHHQQRYHGGYSDSNDIYASQASQDPMGHDTVLADGTALTGWSQSQRGAPATQAVSQDDFRNMGFSQDIENDMAKLMLSQNP